MQNLLEELKKLLEQDERLVVEGKLLKNKIIESALKLDVDLIRLLLKSETIKTHFFQEVDGVLVFDKIKFQKFVSNKAFLPDSYTSFKNKIGLVTENEEYLSESKEVVLVWPYKECVLEGGMEKEDEKRDEIFYNEILAPDEIDRLLEPKVLTNFKRIDKNGEHKVQEIKGNDNLIIRGNNLLALHSLQKRFAGKVKLIYIDPPYNTGNDSFKYNDSFNHSTWLTFMKNRVEVAKQLLRNDGVIFVQCDDSEQAYLKILLDEIFGIDNNQVTLYIQVRYEGKSLTEKNDYQKLIEHIFVYSKNNFKPIKTKEEYSIESFCWEIEELSEGKRTQIDNKEMTIFKKGEYKFYKKESSIKRLKETWASGTVLKNNASGKFFEDNLAKRVSIDGLEVLYKVKGIGEDGLGYRYFTGPKKEGATKGKFYSGVPLKRLEELKKGKSFKFKSISNFYNLSDHFGNCRQEGGVELRGGKKPEILLKKIIEISTKKEDIVLDFHLGTGTTCTVAHKMGRQYIGIEQLDYGENDSVVRLKNVINGDQSGISKSVNWQGGGDFIYCELMKLNEKYIDEIKKVETTKELIDIWKTMKEKAFLSYKVDVKKFDLPAATSTTQAGESVKEFEQLNIENQKKFLIECLDKNQLYINLSEIDDTEYEISKEDKELNKQFYEVR